MFHTFQFKIGYFQFDSKPRYLAVKSGCLHFNTVKKRKKKIVNLTSETCVKLI